MSDAVEEKHISPIDSVEGLFKFHCNDVDKDLISTRQWKSKEKVGRKVLVCHDMAGGYLDDKFVNGSDNPGCYNFYHWAQIDVFVYFSHHLVTIPPLMWVEAAHKNGVLVLGTFITEWDAGRENCEIIWASIESSIHYAKKLVDIAHTYNFDGWLINIENTLESDQIDNMHVFLQFLTNGMRELSPNNLVIWYDAVTIDGDLAWQNGVTDLNFPFLQCCDGIFLNYSWKDWNLDLTMDLCPERLTDIFTGIDVWGRNCVGKFETHLSAEKISNYGLSVALFAPAWCYESNNGNFEKFLQDNNKFWELLRNMCPPNPVQLKLDEDYCTNFDFGFGKKVFEYGYLLYLKSWFNLSKQDAPFVSFLDNATWNVSIYPEDAFQGSTSLKIVNLGNGSDNHCLCHLISVNVTFDSGRIKLVCKNLVDCNLSDINLLVTDKKEEVTKLSLDSISIIGGNEWYELSFAICDLEVKWIGIEVPNTNASFLIGQLSFSV